MAAPAAKIIFDPKTILSTNITTKNHFPIKIHALVNQTTKLKVLVKMGHPFKHHIFACVGNTIVKFKQKIGINNATQVPFHSRYH